MMGKSHAMSGSAVALSSAAFGFGPLDALTAPLSVVAIYTAVMTGGALWPDWDSKSSTVVRSFGIFGSAIHEVVNALSLLAYNLTRAKRDKPREGGHRTLFHTLLFALVTGAIISGLSSLPVTVTLLGKDFALGQLFSLVIMWAFLHVGLAGLFEKTIKRARGMFSVYGVMFASLGGTVIVSMSLPEGETYWWLGIAATAGMIIHLLGDMITKQGIPLFWPLPIIGKHWFDVTLPSFLRITAGGATEKVILFPIFVVITVFSALFCIPPIAEWIRPILDSMFA